MHPTIVLQRLLILLPQFAFAICIGAIVANGSHQPFIYYIVTFFIVFMLCIINNHLTNWYEK